MGKTLIYYLNWNQDQFLIKQTGAKKSEFQPLELGESLYNDLCQIVANSWQLMKEITPVSAHHQELHEGAYKAAIYSLVYKWELESTGLLEAWAQFGCRLARGHYFTNGNKRTALLAMITFIQACGFGLPVEPEEILLQKWQKLWGEVVIVESEEMAVELVKDRILLQILKYYQR
ncbi:MAG: hypothetical protein MRERV_3c114 [Mycoplasmataceae bacterium RV_VA103A]|nr:MAG: hypothetical protein MRERV_3c114 [Mycoplasmataceae bacterium RV_VA103A]